MTLKNTRDTRGPYLKGGKTKKKIIIKEYKGPLPEMWKDLHVISNTKSISSERWNVTWMNHVFSKNSQHILNFIIFL